MTFVQARREKQILLPISFQMVDNYSCLKGIVDELNQCAKTIMLVGTALGLITFSSYLLVITDNSDPRSVIVLTFAVLMYFGSMCLAAHGHELVCSREKKSIAYE